MVVDGRGDGEPGLFQCGAFGRAGGDVDDDVIDFEGRLRLGGGGGGCDGGNEGRDNGDGDTHGTAPSLKTAFK